MTTPKPWSFTSLDDFKNCPKAFYEKKVAKRFVEERSEQMIWGERVHKAFEDYVGLHTELPTELLIHQPFLDKLMAKPGIDHTEMKIAIDKKGQPCHFFDKDVWYRGVIDWHKVHDDTGTCVDYKTGKPHEKFIQLYMFAIHMFMMYPIRLVNVQFYWTQTQTVTKKVVSREEIPQLWGSFLPDLKQYAQAFKEDIWQMRPSGLCHGWCPVTDCENWKPKRSK